MQKVYQLKKSYKDLGERLIDSVRAKGFIVFGVREARIELGLSSGKAKNLLSRMARKGRLVRIIRDKYCLGDTELIKAATRLFWPSYVSFWSAIRFHNLTEQLPLTAFVANTRFSRTIDTPLGRMVFVRLDRRRFFGYEMVGGVQVAEKEKALVDSLLFPRYSGGIVEVYKAMCNARAELNPRKLIRYALRMRSKSLIQRLGYLLERGGFTVPEKELTALRRWVGKAFARLDPRRPAGKKYDNKWMLNLNIPGEELERAGMGI